MGNSVTVKVRSSSELKKVHAVVLGRVGVSFSKTLQATEPDSLEFSFEATSEMVPQATLFVYYYQPTGEIINDKVLIKLDQKLPNHVSIKNLQQGQK